MAADLNRVTLVGRLTRDPALRDTSSTPVASLRIAVNGRGRDEEGGWVDRPGFFDVTVFGRQAETANQYLAKGRRVGIDGRMQWREWVDRDGATRQAVEVVANDIYFLDSRDDAGGSGATTAPATTTAARPTDDDLPF